MTGIWDVYLRQEWFHKYQQLFLRGEGFTNTISFRHEDVFSKNLFMRGDTTRKVSKYRVIPGPYFPVFSPNTGKYGPEKTSCLDTSHAVKIAEWAMLSEVFL